MTLPERILFYSANGEYGFLSNFYRAPFMVDGKEWRTSEHYFQAHKFAGTDHEEAIRLIASPMVAARMGRSRKRPLRPDWEQVKDQIMREAVTAKFSQNADLHAALLATGSAMLVEHVAKDRYWGDGGDGSGQNRLGHILMEVRDALK
jgi:N-glycosidase YbiA